MNRQAEKPNGKPVYMQLYKRLRRDIVDGVYPHGSKLPSKRCMAEEGGISVITVEHAYALLTEEGYVESRERSGYFVVYRADDFAPLHEEEVRTLRPSHTHTAATHFPFSVLAKTMRRVLSEKGESLLVKSPNHGCAALRSAVAAYLQRRHGMMVRPEQVIVGSGAEYLYSLIVQLLGKERVFGLEHPSYDKIRRVYEAHGVTCDLLCMGADGIATPELVRTAATVLHITPFNSFPSGVTASASKRAEYLRWADKRQGYLVEDNYDSELTVSTKNEEPLFGAAENGRVLYLSTFSRTVAPSIRVGYMVLPPSLLAPFERILGFYSCTVPLFEQYVLAELLNNGDFERHINRVRRARRKEKDGHLVI